MAREKADKAPCRNCLELDKCTWTVAAGSALDPEHGGEGRLHYLRDRTGSTDGNIAAHLLKLEQPAYISVERPF